MSKGHMAIMAGLVALLGACGEGGEPAAQEVDVTAANFAFDPSSISAEAGETIEITLTNEDDTEHSFTIDDVVEVEADGGEEASTTFTAPDETVEFYCKYHPDRMRGELVVGGGSPGGEDEAGGGDDEGGGGAEDQADY